MYEIMCRACLVPQGTFDYTSIYVEGGKIAKDILKLTNILIMDLNEINCPAVICERCLMDLDRAIKLRDLIIQSDAELKELSNKNAVKVLKKITAEVPEESEAINDYDLEDSDNCLTSIVKEEQFESSCVNSNNVEQFKLLDELNGVTYEEPLTNFFDSDNFLLNDSQYESQVTNKGSIKCRNIKSLKRETRSTKKPTIIEIRQLDEAESSQLQCNICCKSFTRKCYLTQHFQTVHMHKKNKFRCSKCGKRYPTQEILDVHLVKHDDNKPFKCSMCPKSFNHKADLKRHDLNHANIKPHVCKICKRGFARNDHLVKHMKVHGKNK